MSSTTTRKLQPGSSKKQDREAATQQPPVLGLSSSKVQAQHLEGLAIVYIRQSSPQQVLEHRESTRRQYGLVDYAVALGWPRERVLVIDEDQGQSGKYVEGRAGFQRVLAEVGLDHVGIVLGLEMSRLARSDKDWHHLLEVCGIFGTLLGDQDGVYDAADPNDRLLLGLKGTISSVELQTMRNRLEKGKLNKAMRGELFLDVPVGYVKLATGQLALDPDEQAQAIIGLIFDKFEELGTVRAVFRYLLKHGICLGIRPHDGPNKGQLQWRRPCLTSLYRILHHPYYAGTYAYGRFPVDPKRQSERGGRKSRKSASMDEWKVRLQDCVPGYISWDTYLGNQERLRQNCSRWETTGAPREGAALLSGVIICGQCGTRMQVRYSDTQQGRYDCAQHLRNGHKRKCHGLPASVVDQLVGQQLLRALEPAALEVSLNACDAIQKDRKRLALHWQQQLERVRYESDQAERRYRAVDPENRLVARTLEQQWEEALRNQRQREEEYDRIRRETPLDLGQADKDRIRALANDLPELWDSPTTGAVERKEIVRCLVERVTVHVQGNTEYVDVTINWIGGFVSQHVTRRPVAEYRQMRDYDGLVQRLRELSEAGHTAREIAEVLNTEGYQPTGQRATFRSQTVRHLMSRLRLSGERHDTETLNPHEWWLSDLARTIGVSLATGRRWILRGWVHARRSLRQGYYIVWADDEELARLGQLRDYGKMYPKASCPPDLTTPKSRSI